MKTFFKDLWDLQKASFAFIKKHPVGYTVFTLGSGLIGGAIGAIPIIKNGIETKQLENEMETESEVEEA